MAGGWGEARPALPATGTIVNPDTINVIKVIAYMIVGTLGIVLLFGWALKRFGSPKD
jgi:flagellar biogenesis protein FliO